GCSAELDACSREPACAPFLECDAACGKADLDCESLCMGIYGVPTAVGVEAWDLLHCRAAQCEPSCGLPCNGACLGNLGCDQCLASKCRDVGQALAASAEASRALGCEAADGALFGNQPKESSIRCLPKHDSGVDAFSSWNACRTTACL